MKLLPTKTAPKKRYVLARRAVNMIAYMGAPVSYRSSNWTGEMSGKGIALIRASCRGFRVCSMTNNPRDAE